MAPLLLLLVLLLPLLLPELASPCLLMLPLLLRPTPGAATLLLSAWRSPSLPLLPLLLLWEQASKAAAAVCSNECRHVSA